MTEQASFIGRKNIYVCEECRGHIVTMDLEDGVTPFLIGCQVTEECSGMMKSSMYRVYDQSMKAGYFWAKPESLDDLSPGERAHVENGGLLLNEAPDI